MVVTHSVAYFVLYGMAGKKVASLKTEDATDDLKRIGAQIRQLRIEAGYTSYEAFANEHDVHRVQWGRYEAGNDLYASTLIKVIRLLDVSVSEFFSVGFDS